jgi:hypothetical protein
MPNEQIPTWTREAGKAGSLAPLRGSRYPLIDAHLHVVNFVQQTPGGPALLDAMDRANVGRAVIFGLPVAKIWDEDDREPPDYYLANDPRCYYKRYTDGVVAELVGAPCPPEVRERLYLMLRLQTHRSLAQRDVERLYAQYPDVCAASASCCWPTRRSDRPHKRRSGAGQPPALAHLRLCGDHGPARVVHRT